MEYLYNTVREKHSETVVCMIHRAYTFAVAAVDFPKSTFLQKSRFREKKDQGQHLTAVVIILQATEVFFGNALMLLYGFDRECQSTAQIARRSETEKETEGPSEVYMLWR